MECKICINPMPVHVQGAVASFNDVGIKWNIAGIWKLYMHGLSASVRGWSGVT
jgi:hypothetical protein